MTTNRVDVFQAPYDKGFTLAAATPLVLVFDIGESRGAFGLCVQNTGSSHPIDTTKIELSLVSDTDAEYQDQTAIDSSIGSTAALGKFTYSKVDDPNRFVRVTLTSTLGTTVQVQARAL